MMCCYQRNFLSAQMSIVLHDAPIENVEIENTQQSYPEKNNRIRCKSCHFHLTQKQFAISPKGRHQHLQCNPSGITFIFNCFSRASGCYISGKPSSEFSWFKGFDWQFASCQGCGEHLGWYFSHSQEENFFAIIDNKMEFVEE